MSRFRLVTDDSCHWYAIPADEQDDFERWVKSFDDGAPQYGGPDYSEYRLNTHISNYTFPYLCED